jgi:hypothetical protein
MEMNHLELEVLRYLYGPREFDDVIAKFKMAFETCDIIISDS